MSAGHNTTLRQLRPPWRKKPRFAIRAPLAVVLLEKIKQALMNCMTGELNTKEIREALETLEEISYIDKNGNPIDKAKEESVKNKFRN